MYIYTPSIKKGKRKLKEMFESYLSPTRLVESYLHRSMKAVGLTAQTVAVDGETTVHLWAPPVPENGKPALLLLHGLGPTAQWQWRRQIKTFSSSFSLYMPDLIFFGLSTSSSHQRSEIFQAECMAKMMEKVGVERYHVAGTSYGGFVAYHVARMWPEKVEKAVIASSGVNARRSDSEELLVRGKCRHIDQILLPSSAAELRRLLSLSSSSRLLRLVPDFLWEDFVHKLYIENRDKKAELLEGVSFGQDETLRLAPLSQEVLIVWGDQDLIFPIKMAYELEKVIGPKARLEIIKNTSHIPNLERPEEFNDIVFKFLNGSY